MSTATTSSSDFIWIRAYVTPASAPSYEVLMQCRRTYSYCPAPQIGATYTAELKSTAAALDALHAYPNAAPNPVKLDVRTDAKHKATWSLLRAKGRASEVLAVLDRNS